MKTDSIGRGNPPGVMQPWTVPSPCKCRGYRGAGIQLE
nr:MAG TPA: hypothetical protein [Caudoviricetes sp.]